MTDKPDVPRAFILGMVALQCQQIESGIGELRTLLLRTDFFSSLTPTELTTVMRSLNDGVDAIRAIRDDAIEDVNNE